MTQDEALRVLGLLQLPSSEKELDTAYTTITQRTQNELHCAANGAATEAVMNKLARLQQAKLTLLHHARGQAIPNVAQQSYHAPGPAPHSSNRASSPVPQPSSHPTAAPSPGPTPPPSPSSSPVAPTPARYYSPPRRSVWLRFWQMPWSAVQLLWHALTWPLTAPWRALRWVHTRLQSWRILGLSGLLPWPGRKRRIVAALVLAAVCVATVLRYFPGGASVMLLTFPEADVFIDDMYITTAPSPEHFEVSNWGWQEIVCMTPEGLTHRFHVLLLPGQTYRVKVNLQDDTHTVTRHVAPVATTQTAETEWEG